MKFQLPTTAAHSSPPDIIHCIPKKQHQKSEVILQILTIYNCICRFSFPVTVQTDRNSKGSEAVPTQEDKIQLICFQTGVFRMTAIITQEWIAEKHTCTWESFLVFVVDCCLCPFLKTQLLLNNIKYSKPNYCSVVPFSSSPPHLLQFLYIRHMIVSTNNIWTITYWNPSPCLINCRIVRNAPKIRENLIYMVNKNNTPYFVVLGSGGHLKGLCDFFQLRAWCFCLEENVLFFYLHILNVNFQGING